MRNGSRSVAAARHGDGVLCRCRRCVLLKDCLNLHVAVRHGEFIVGDDHAAADDLPLLKPVAGVGRGGQGDLRANHSCGRACGAAAVSVNTDGDGVGGGWNNAVFPQCLDPGISVHSVGISHLVLRAANLPHPELLICGSGEAAGGQNVICSFLDGYGFHAAAAAVAIKGDGTVSKRRTPAHSDLCICAGKVVVVLRIADEIIAGRQVLNLRAATRCIAAVVCHTVFHLVGHAGDSAVASALGGRCDTGQAVRRFLRDFADAPRCGHGLRAAVRPFAGPGCNTNGVIARVCSGVAGDVHRGGIITRYGCSMLGAIVGVGSGDADAGLGRIGGHGRRILLKDCLDLHIAVRHEKPVAGDYKSCRRFDLPLPEAIAGVGHGGQGNLRAGYGFCMRGRSRSAALCGDSDGILGRCVFGYRNRQLLCIAAPAVFRLNGEGCGSLCRGLSADPAGILIQLQTVGQSAAADAPCDGRSAVGCQGLAVRLTHLAVRQGIRGDGHGMTARIIKQCRQLIHIRRNIIAQCIELAIAAKPHKVAAGISVGAGQAVAAGRGKALAGFHNDLDSIRAAAQFAAAKVKGDGFQAVSAQSVRVQDFQDRAEIKGIRRFVETPVADRAVPTVRTTLRVIVRSILPPRTYIAPVFDISVVFVQYLVPFVALRVAAYRLARARIRASCGRRAQRIFHAAGSIVFSKNQPCGIQVVPAYRMRHRIVCHKQAVFIFVLLCILLCGCHR